MKKTTFSLGLALALAAGTVSAQQTQPQAPQQHGQHERGAGEARGRRGPGGPGGFLLKGITLSDAQKQQLQALRKDDKGDRKADREQFRKTFEEARALRAKGDTAGARAKLAPIQAQMQKERDAQVAQIRNILTAEQRKQFDANVAEAKQRQAERGDRGPWGRGGERGGRRNGGK